VSSILFFDDVSKPLGYRLREAWLVQFPRRAGLIFYFCQEDEEYERLLMAGPESGHFLVITDPGKMTVRSRSDDDRDQSYLVFCPDMKFLETARLGYLREQQVIAVFPKGLDKETMFDIYPDADWSEETLVFGDLSQIDKWRDEFASEADQDQF
jgi:hypothetical protein